jgi:iron complex outermembrane receptor protein
VKTTLKLSSAALAIAMFGAGSGPALAQDAAAEDAASDDIIVTAQRRDQSIQEVPLTIQAFSGNTLGKLNVTTFNEFVKYTPNVTFGNNGPGNGAIFMRGLSAGFAGQQSSATISGFPNVALYLDDQSMQFPARNADVYVADIERIEVLEGPQGTLFGGGAQAGVVRYITNKPRSDKFEAAVEGSFGGTAGGSVNGAFNAMVNLPIIEDKLSIRAVVYADHRGGYIDNKYSTFTRRPTDLGSYYLNYTDSNGVNNGNQLTPAQQTRGGQYDNAALVEDNFNPVDYAGGRVALKWEITPDWDILVSQAYQSLNTKGTFAAQTYTYDYAPLTGLSSTLFSPQYSKDEYYNTAWSVNGSIGDFKLIYTGAYLRRNITQQGDYTNYARATYGIFYQCTGAANYYFGTFGGAPFCYEPTSYWLDKVKNTHETHEFRISTPDSGRFRAIVGGFYESFAIEDNMDWSYKTIPDCGLNSIAANLQAAGTVCLGRVAPNPNATLNVAGPRGPAVAFGQDIQRGFKQYAGFASVDFDIFENLTITGGTRYYKYDNYETGSVYSSFNAGCYQVPVCTTGSNLDAQGLKSSYSGFRSKGTITWKPKDGTLVYATYSQGFRPGAFNRGSSARVQDPLLPFLGANGQGSVVNTGNGRNFQLLVPAAYRPDNLTNWEIGLKTDLFDRKVTLNLSGYYMQWKDTQIGFFNPAAGFGNTAFATNGPTYDIKGVEAQLTIRPNDGLTINSSATYNDSKQANAPCFIANNPTASGFGQCITATFAGSYDANGVPLTRPVQSPFGNKGGVTPFSPKFQGNIRARYEWAGKGEMNWFVAGGVNYTSSMFNQPATYPSGDVPGNGNVLGPNGIIVPATTVLRYKMKGYALADFQMGFTRDNVTFTIFGDNIFNSKASTFTNSAQYIKTSTIVRPLTYGIKIGVKM